MKLNEYSKVCHQIAVEKGFWNANNTISTKLMLIVTEIAEACEADRKGDFENFKEELADTFIRLFDLCGSNDIDIEKEINNKIITNKGRPKLHDKKY